MGRRSHGRGPKPRWRRTPGGPHEPRNWPERRHNRLGAAAKAWICPGTQEEVPEITPGSSRENHSTDHPEGNFHRWRGGDRGVDDLDRDRGGVFRLLLPVPAFGKTVTIRGMCALFYRNDKMTRQKRTNDTTIDYWQIWGLNLPTDNIEKYEKK